MPLTFDVEIKIDSIPRVNTFVGYADNTPIAEVENRIRLIYNLFGGALKLSENGTEIAGFLENGRHYYFEEFTKPRSGKRSIGPSSSESQTSVENHIPGF